MVANPHWKNTMWSKEERDSIEGLNFQHVRLINE